VPPRAEVTFGRSVTYALENMRPLLKMRTDPVWQTRATWGGAHVGTATAGHVEATGRAATFFRPVAEAATRLRAIAKCGTPLKKRRWIVSAELAANIRRRAHAAKLLTQCHIPVGHTSAMHWIVRPNSHPIDAY
jgi:hypothetical protein